MTEQAETVEPDEAAPVSTAMDRLRDRRRRAMEAPRHLDLPVPGFSGELVARYKPLPWATLVPLMEQSESDDPEESLTAHAHTLIEACSVLLVPGDGDELVSLADELRAAGQKVHGEVTFGANNHLVAEIIDVPQPETARDLLLDLFDGAISPEVQVTQQAITYGRWMRGVSEEVDAELGEG